VDKNPRLLTEYSAAIEVLVPPGLEQDKLTKWRGRSFEWCFVELMVFSIFVMTMLLLILKSRVWKVGIDHSHQFAPTYMSFLANKIARQLDFDFYEFKQSREQTKQMFTT